MIFNNETRKSAMKFLYISFVVLAFSNTLHASEKEEKEEKLEIIKSESIFEIVKDPQQLVNIQKGVASLIEDFKNMSTFSIIEGKWKRGLWTSHVTYLGLSKPITYENEKIGALGIFFPTYDEGDNYAEGRSSSWGFHPPKDVDAYKIQLKKFISLYNDLYLKGDEFWILQYLNYNSLSQVLVPKKKIKTGTEARLVENMLNRRMEEPDSKYKFPVFELGQDLPVFRIDYLDQLMRRDYGAKFCQLNLFPLKKEEKKTDELSADF